VIFRRSLTQRYAGPIYLAVTTDSAGKWSGTVS
jgi:hypothetical protein